MLSQEHVRASLILSSEVVGPETRKMLTGLPPHLFRGEMNALADTQTTRLIVLIDWRCRCLQSSGYDRIIS